MMQTMAVAAAVAFLWVRTFVLEMDRSLWPLLSAELSTPHRQLVCAGLKALPIVILARGTGSQSAAVTVGLLFSAVGDVVLALDDRFDEAFLVGLAAFFAAHVAYVAAFLSWRPRPRRLNLAAAVGVACGALFLLWNLLPHVHRSQAELLVPVRCWCGCGSDCPCSSVCVCARSQHD